MKEINKNVMGEMCWINKNEILFDKSYQRVPVKMRVNNIARDWSWIACGIITIAERDGLFYAIDGQHRVLASKKVKEVVSLPCLVFHTGHVKQEANGFLQTNTARKAMGSMEVYRALILSEDETALKVKDLLRVYNIKATNPAEKARELTCIAWVIKHAKRNIIDLEIVLKVASAVCFDSPIKVRLLEGLMYAHKHLDCGITDNKLFNRLVKIGNQRLLDTIQRSASVFGRGSDDICGNAILQEVNNGLKNKYEFVVKGR